MNAYKHGRRSKKLASLREDTFEFEPSQKWMARLDPCDDVEQFLADHIVVMSCELDRAKRAHLEHLRSLVENSDDAQVDHVYELGKRLFFDPCGPSALFGFAPGVSKQKTSWGGALGGESTGHAGQEAREGAPGCLFLRDEWEALWALLEPGKCSGSSHWLKATRLLGRQPGDALGDPDVALILIGSLEPGALGPRLS